MKQEMSHLEMTLKELEKPMDYFWRTALYLREKELAAKKRMEWLKTQQKAQGELRSKHARGQTPPEVVDRVLSYIPTYNALHWGSSDAIVSVDGLLHPAVYSPSILLQYFANPFSSEWTLEDIARQKAKQTVLEEELLRKHLKLRVETSDTSCLSPLMKYPHQWKTLMLNNKVRV